MMMINQPKTIHERLIPNLFLANTNENSQISIIDNVSPNIQSV